MSNPDSFVDEVTEAVRSDRLYASFRRYGWIGGVLVLGIVGGAAWFEWQQSQADARAEAFGDGIQAALAAEDAAGRLAALNAVKADGGQAALVALLKAADPEGDKAQAIAALEALAVDPSQPQLYKDLAVLKKVGLQGTGLALADRRAALQSIAVPGRAFRTLAEEQLAYLLIEEGKPDEALAALTTLIQDQEAPAGLRQRLSQVIVALGGDVPEQRAPEGAMPDAG